LDPALAAVPFLALWGAAWLLLPWISPTNAGMRRGAVVVFCVLQGQYIWWRLGCTPPASWNATFLYALFVVALECILMYPGYKYIRSLAAIRLRSEEADAHQRWHQGSPPMVDILIPTYNESWSILEKTIIGALNQDYPRIRVWVCDDGRRPWLKAAAEELGVRYVTRSDNKHAKSGNLNNALRHVQAEPEASDFVAVLDADFIPRQRFVTRTLALMHDPEVGIVQTPQYHYNRDLFQNAFNTWDRWPDTQRSIFDVVLPARDGTGTAYCCGTSFLARTEAMWAIGGFPIESITEDVLTTMKMSAIGYRTVYLREPLTTGLAPEGVHEYLTQRGRWCLGGVQIAWWLSSQLGADATPWRRLWTMEPFLRWGYTSAIRLIFMLIPLVFWFTGVAPFEAPAWQILICSFPLLVFNRVYVSWLSRGTQLPILAQAGGLLSTVAVLPAFLKGLFVRHDHRFVVTDKGVLQTGIVVHWKTLRWFVGYAALTIGGVIYQHVRPTEMIPTTVMYIAYVWTAVNLAIVVIAAYPCLELPRRRGEDRYPASESATVATAAGRAPAEILDLSLSGARLSTAAPIAVGQRLEVTLSGMEAVGAEAVRAIGANVFGVRFALTDRQRHDLIRRIYCSDAYVFPPAVGSARAALTAVMRRVLL
jgi:cellulose synthase (UDP-forming)